MCTVSIHNLRQQNAPRPLMCTSFEPGTVPAHSNTSNGSERTHPGIWHQLPGGPVHLVPRDPRLYREQANTPHDILLRCLALMERRLGTICLNLPDVLPEPLGWDFWTNALLLAVPAKMVYQSVFMPSSGTDRVLECSRGTCRQAESGVEYRNDIRASW